MTRQEKLAALEEKFQPILKNKGDLLQAAQDAFNQKLGLYEERKRIVNAYYDALDAKASAQVVILNGEPTI